MKVIREVPITSAELALLQRALSNENALIGRQIAALRQEIASKEKSNFPTPLSPSGPLWASRVRASLCKTPNLDWMSSASSLGLSRRNCELNQMPGRA